MFEEKTAAAILAEMLDGIPAQVDKREGSIIYDALAPAAAEIAQLYVALGALYENSFVDTADLDSLILKAKERGIDYRAAECAVIAAQIEVIGALTIGDRFFCGNIGFTYAGMSDQDAETETTYPAVLHAILVAETAGAAANGASGSLVYDGSTPIVRSAYITQILHYGRDAETADALRQRYYDDIDSAPFGGNIADYKARAMTVSGVGGVQVRRTWNGPGTVKLVIVDETYSAPSDVLVRAVQQYFDPDTGYAAAEARAINIGLKLQYKAGYAFDNTLADIRAALSEYLAAIAKEWAESGQAAVYTGRISMALLSVHGVAEVLDVVIDGNTAYDGDAIPVLGEVTEIAE